MSQAAQKYAIVTNVNSLTISFCMDSSKLLKVVFEQIQDNSSVPHIMIWPPSKRSQQSQVATSQQKF